MPSPLYPDLNQDPNVTGGVMDAPDLDVRKATLKATLKAQMGQALTPYELGRLANRQSLEAENARASSPIYGNAARSNATATGNAAAAGAIGPGGIDVNSYVGSIYGPAGSARPISAPRTTPIAPPADSARNPVASPAAGAPTLTAPPYVPAPVAPPAPSSNSVANLLTGTRLDPGVRELGEQMNRAKLDATRIDTLGAQASLTRHDRNDAAARAAIAPGADGSSPSADQILRNYIANGGSIDPAILTAAARPPKAAPGGFATAEEASKSIPKDSEGRVQQSPTTGRWTVEYGVNKPAHEDPKTELFRLTNERESWRAMGRMDVVKNYDQMIEKLASKFNIWGNLIEPKDAAGKSAEPAKGEPVKPSKTPPAKPEDIPTLSATEAAKLPVGAKFKTTDGRILTRH